MIESSVAIFGDRKEDVVEKKESGCWKREEVETRCSSGGIYEGSSCLPAPHSPNPLALRPQSRARSFTPPGSVHSALSWCFASLSNCRCRCTDFITQFKPNRPCVALFTFEFLNCSPFSILCILFTTAVRRACLRMCLRLLFVCLCFTFAAAAQAWELLPAN